MLIKEFLIAEGLLYLDGYTFKNHKTFKDFVYHLVTYYVNQFDTYQVDDRSLQCAKGQHRSFGDLYRICVTYFPKLNPTKLKKTLVKLLQEKKLNSLTCGNIVRRTYYTRLGNSNHMYANVGVADDVYYDEYGMLWNEYNMHKHMEYYLIYSKILPQERIPE